MLKNFQKALIQNFLGFFHRGRIPQADSLGVTEKLLKKYPLRSTVIVDTRSDNFLKVIFGKVDFLSKKQGSNGFWMVVSGTSYYLSHTRNTQKNGVVLQKITVFFVKKK